MSCFSLADEHIASYPIFIRGNNMHSDGAAPDKDESHDELYFTKCVTFYLLELRIYFRY